MAKKVSFVAIGDSLTLGYMSKRLADLPYFDFIRSFRMREPIVRPSYPSVLKEYADNFLKGLKKKDNIQIQVKNRGVGGNLTSTMLLRFSRDVIELKPDYVIILGGTNDIAHGLPPKEIFSNIARMFQKATDKGIKPIGCTIPSVLGCDEGIPPRMELNQLLKNFCHAKAVTCADLFAATCDPKTKRLRAEFSSDGLHLNIAGYRKIAEAIFEESVKAILLNELSAN